MEARKGLRNFRHMIIIYMQDTLKLLKEFPTPTRVGQTERGTYVVYEYPNKEEQKKHIVDIMKEDEEDGAEDDFGIYSSLQRILSPTRRDTLGATGMSSIAEASEVSSKSGSSTTAIFFEDT